MGNHQQKKQEIQNNNMHWYSQVQQVTKRGKAFPQYPSSNTLKDDVVVHKICC